jgi:pyruvate/2-oxoglutarate dehydrogenase complex dihydrolipoamide acyltransferase (E2) component
VEIHPMMLHLYDHRIIDGKESVGFLVAIKGVKTQYIIDNDYI